jgi:hypothetical protein
VSTNRVIDIVVDCKGRVTVQTRGFAGQACKEASRFLEEALGRRGMERLTAEYYQRSEAGQQLHQSE